MPKPTIDPSKIKIEDFQYDLPDKRIARYPLEQRDKSKLLVYKSKEINEDVYQNLTDYIPEDSLMIFNQAKVVHARLYFKKSTGGKIEIFCLEPDDRYADITLAMAQEGEVYWKCLLRGASKWKDNSPLLLEVNFTNSKNECITINAKAHKVSQEGHTFTIRFSWISSDYQTLSFSEFLEHAGKIPIPPYLKRKAEESDEKRYQTIFAKQEGSVAAPTAGLHFTPYITKALQHKNITLDKLTLHVGAGTFMPVKSDRMEGHEMHAEWIEIPKDLLKDVTRQIKTNKKIIAVGTTSARTLESAYWIGVQILRKEWSPNQNIAVSQWYPYQQKDEFSPLEAAEALIANLEENKLEKIITQTQVIIAPGYDFKLLDGLITNFHQPASTLLLMISALTGENWKKIYNYALENNFRFLSYGDGSLLWRNQKS